MDINLLNHKLNRLITSTSVTKLFIIITITVTNLYLLHGWRFMLNHLHFLLWTTMKYI